MSNIIMLEINFTKNKVLEKTEDIKNSSENFKNGKIQ